MVTTAVKSSPLIGFFVNTLVMRASLQDDPSFNELLGQVREVALEAYAHQDLPFEKLVDELEVERNLSRTPLFQVMFVWQHIPLKRVELPELTLHPVELEHRSAKFDLTLNLAESGQRLQGAFEYDTDLFDSSTIKRMVGHFATLLEGIATDPRQRISELPLLDDQERNQLLVQFNDTQANYRHEVGCPQLFEEQAARTPDAVAVVYGDQQLTYRELNARANRLARHLRTLGVGPDVPVAICVERSMEMVVGVLGVLKAGGVYVPVDPALPSQRVQFMLQDSAASVLVTLSSLVEQLPDHDARVVCLDRAEQVVAESAENLSSGVTAANAAYVIYTSGSTGRTQGRGALSCRAE